MRKKKFYKKVVNLKLAIYILFITTILAAMTSMSKFGKVFVGNDSVTVAIPVFASTTINLQTIYPDMETKKYDIIVKNTKDNITSQVSVDYIINLKTIGNIPLSIRAYKTENSEIISENLIEDGISRPITMNPEETTHTYELQIDWDKTLENYKNYEYSGETSIMKLNIDAVQKD